MRMVEIGNQCHFVLFVEFVGFEIVGDEVMFDWRE